MNPFTNLKHHQNSVKNCYLMLRRIALSISYFESVLPIRFDSALDNSRTIDSNFLWNPSLLNVAEILRDLTNKQYTFLRTFTIANIVTISLKTKYLET